PGPAGRWSGGGSRRQAGPDTSARTVQDSTDARRDRPGSGHRSRGAMDGVRLVASDLDGPLLLPDETVSERTRAALAAARAAGITVVLGSGGAARHPGP